MQKKILRAVRKIKVVMEVDSMRSMYSEYMFQQKQVTYLEAVKKDLQVSLAQLKNTAEIPKVTNLTNTLFNLLMILLYKNYVQNHISYYLLKS